MYDLFDINIFDIRYIVHQWGVRIKMEEMMEAQQAEEKMVKKKRRNLICYLLVTLIVWFAFLTVYMRLKNEFGIEVTSIYFVIPMLTSVSLKLVIFLL